MPRAARRDGAGAVHHVMLRGIERRRIFWDDDDRGEFVERLARLIREEGFLCYAWALMPNHVHAILRTGLVPLSRLMARLGTGYAQHFNRRHGRTGHLFQNRFKSLLVEDGVYARQLVRYVHANPLRAGIVASLEELEAHPWTGHGELMGRAARGPTIVDRREVLGWFDPDPRTGRGLLRAWMADDEACEAVPPAEGASRVHGRGESALDLGSLLGAEPFGKGPADTRPSLQAALPLALPVRDLDSLIVWVCSELGADEVDVRSGRRTRPESRARAAIAYLGKTHLGLSGAQLAPKLSLGSGPFSRAVTRGRAVVTSGLREGRFGG